MKKYLFTAMTAILACNASVHVHAQKEIALFNGKDLSNWKFVVDGNRTPAEQVFSVSNGVIEIAGAPIGYMYTKQVYGDGTLDVEWRWAGEASNSGIFLLIEDPKNPFPNGIECQLHAGDAGDLVLLGGSDLAEYRQPEGQERPKFPVIKKRSASSEKPAGEWNHARIEIQDGAFTVYINGVLQNTGTDKVKKGHIGLQSEGEKIQFRNITLTKK
ncbi:MAG: DUF1080 domain-containing protein [Tannerella sp.]|jgi:hypothetical protein|nr:DUF1080 domain-containing protein [Tannerella sp.]